MKILYFMAVCLKLVFWEILTLQIQHLENAVNTFLEILLHVFWRFILEFTWKLGFQRNSKHLVPFDRNWYIIKNRYNSKISQTITFKIFQKIYEIDAREGMQKTAAMPGAVFF